MLLSMFAEGPHIQIRSNILHTFILSNCEHSVHIYSFVSWLIKEGHDKKQSGFVKVIFQNIFNTSDMLPVIVTVSQQAGLKASPIHDLIYVSLKTYFAATAGKIILKLSTFTLFFF
jgi:hypothetical protein